jgi:hypothetical protein
LEPGIWGLHPFSPTAFKGVTVALVWDVGIAEALMFVAGNILGLLSGFMLGVLIRNSAGALVGYFVYAFLIPGGFALWASNQSAFGSVRGWVDIGYAQVPLLELSGTPTSHQWAQIGATGIVWLLAPLLTGLTIVMRSEVK